MAIKRSYSARRGFDFNSVPFKKRRFVAPRTMSTATLARAIAARTSYSRSRKGVDTHFAPGGSSPVCNTADIVSNMANTDFIFPINLIQAGSGSWQRIGRRCYNASLRLKGVITCQYAGSNTQIVSTQSRVLRCVIIHDRQPNGTLPIKSEIIQYKDQAGSEQGDYQGFLSYDNMNRFRILKDFEYTLDPPRDGANTATAQAAISTQKRFDHYLKLNIPTTYSADSQPAVIGDISTGAIYVMFLTNLGSTNPDYGQLSFVGNARLRYTDQ